MLRLAPLLALLASLSLLGCDKGGRGPAEPRLNGRYVVTGDTPFYDSGCQQARLPDGKLKKKTAFTLLSASGSCWNIKLDDEDETYIQPDRVRPE